MVSGHWSVLAVDVDSRPRMRETPRRATKNDIVETRGPCERAWSPIVDNRSCGYCLGKRQDSGFSDIPITRHQASREPREGFCLCSCSDRTVLHPIGVKHRLDSRVEVHPPGYRRERNNSEDQYRRPACPSEGGQDTNDQIASAGSIGNSGRSSSFQVSSRSERARAADISSHCGKHPARLRRLRLVAPEGPARWARTGLVPRGLPFG